MSTTDLTDTASPYRAWGVRWPLGRTERKCSYDEAADVVAEFAGFPHPPVLVSWLTDNPAGAVTPPMLGLDQIGQQVAITTADFEVAVAAARMNTLAYSVETSDITPDERGVLMVGLRALGLIVPTD